MKLKIFEDKQLQEERIEVYCHEKTPMIEAIIQFIEDYDANIMNITDIYNEEKQVLEIKDRAYHHELY